MKVELIEHEGCFEIGLKPESMEDVVLLIRFGINATKEVRSIGAYAHQDKTASAWLVVGKRSKASSEVPKP